MSTHRGFGYSSLSSCLPSTCISIQRECFAALVAGFGFGFGSAQPQQNGWKSCPLVAFYWSQMAPTPTKTVSHNPMGCRRAVSCEKSTRGTVLGAADTKKTQILEYKPREEAARMGLWGGPEWPRKVPKAARAALGIPLQATVTGAARGLAGVGWWAAKGPSKGVSRGPRPRGLHKTYLGCR